jgi:hypothetical protein
MDSLRLTGGRPCAIEGDGAKANQRPALSHMTANAPTSILSKISSISIPNLMCVQSEGKQMHGTRPLTAAERKRRQRERENGNFGKAMVYYSPVVAEALIAQAEDGDVLPEQAEKDSRDRKKVAAALTAVAKEWADLYLKKRDRA